MTTITCYDGVGCIGGNKIFLKDGNTGIWFDFGLNFSHMGKFYEEYLKPKTCLGLYEPIQMGIIPPIKGLYRHDLRPCPKIIDLWKDVEAIDLGETHGILISHAHLDHIGALHYVREDIPIFCSAMTLALAKASQDTGNSGDPKDYAYVAPRRQKETGELETDRTAPTFPRPYYLVGGEPTEELLRFWQETPTTKPHNYGNITTSSTCEDLKIHRFPVDHSIYGASAWVVETNAGLVVYTGDFRCHGLACNYTWEFAKKVAELKPDILITEGTRFNSQNTRTEEDVFHFALDEVKKAKSLVVADFGPRNIERLKIFLEIAKQTRRKLAILTKDAYLLKAMQLIDPNVPSIKDDSSIVIYSEFEANVANWKRSIKEEYAEKLVRPQEVANNQDKFICCFSFFDVNELALIKPAPGSIWIYSSCEAFNEEMKIDLAKLRAWLDKYEVPFLGSADDDQDNPFHVSGHACGTDLIELIKIIRPKNVIPVHIEERNLQKFKDSLNKITNVIVPELGKPIQI